MTRSFYLFVIHFIIFFLFINSGEYLGTASINQLWAYVCISMQDRFCCLPQMWNSPCCAASPHTSHIESSHPPPRDKPASQREKSFSKVTGHTQMRSGVSHLVIGVRVGSVAGAVKSKEVLAIFVHTVHLIFDLKQTHTVLLCCGETPAWVLSLPVNIWTELTGWSLHCSSVNFPFPQSQRKFLHTAQNSLLKLT